MEFNSRKSIAEGNMSLGIETFEGKFLSILKMRIFHTMIFQVYSYKPEQVRYDKVKGKISRKYR